MTEKRLAGRVVLVTGAGRGIGRVVAAFAASEGAAVALASLHEESARTSADKLRSSGADVIPLWGDVGDPGVANVLVSATIERWHRLDAVVHCAGAFHRSPAMDTSDETWAEVVGTNLNGSFFVARESARAMSQTGGGDIVLISSMWGTVGGFGRAAYGAAKAGVNTMGRVLAAEWAKLGIRVYTVAPGWVRTETNQRLVDEGKMDLERMDALAPTRAMLEPEEVANLCLSLTLREHPILSGTVISLDGGMTGWAADV